MAQNAHVAKILRCYSAHTRPNNLEKLYGAQHYIYGYKVQLLLRALGRLGRCQGVLSPKQGHLGPHTGCITPFTTFQCEEHIPSAQKSGPGIHPMHIKLRLYHLIGTLYMLLGWVRMPEGGVVHISEEKENPYLYLSPSSAHYPCIIKVNVRFLPTPIIRASGSHGTPSAK
ncbi:hypothetical protein FRACYDRAFT_255530 [Fragilariopsis cylindrus CCMP1102]|uniref:Uncharacterized protein n=1 Tax=Fragilariopsis cylindrus CCMP1102 TaxID=635003 RepID=A0A1E7EK52_9STRA|nr:hypothetical protein FRACYDRAFT_255530 [Fragilariopsis cylindrus CCMP1102]|eukprot:OEU06266.1 hypothetical protein FRACYDRAFT_255530 [Fragilariopsis cylindrus CCMP1102]